MGLVYLTCKLGKRKRTRDLENKMKATITAKFEVIGNITTFEGYDITVDGQVVAEFYSEYECITHIMDDEDLKLV